MRVFITIVTLFFSGFGFSGSSAFAQEEQDEIEAWIADLASESFKVREKASQQLWRMGEKALPRLQEALSSDDPEVTMRAAEALEKIDLRLTADTSEKVLSLIDAYRKGPANQKLNVLNDLKEEKAYYQMLRLYSLEDASEQRSLATAVQDIAVVAAREAVLGGRIEEAVDLLRVAPPKHSELMALAGLYRYLGQLDEQFENLNPPKHVKPEHWKAFLLRAKGDLDALIAHAGETNQPRLLAGLKALTGDPIAWLEQNQSPGYGTRKANPAYVEIALKRWRGERLGDKDYLPLLRLLKSNNNMHRGQAMSSLMSLGRTEEVKEMQGKENFLTGYLYHLSREEIGKAIKYLGLDEEKPDYAGWVEERFDQIQDGDFEEMTVTQLLLLAGLMESRGLDKELAETYTKPLLELQKKNPDGFSNIVGKLLGGGLGAPDFAVNFVSEWAGNDEERWEEIFTWALGEDELVMEWLIWIREIDPEMGDREALEAMLAIFKQSTTPGSLREDWMKRIWKAVVTEKNEERKMKFVMRILSLCILQQDVLNSLKAWDMLDQEERGKAKWGTIDKYLSAAGRWKDAAEILLVQTEGTAIFAPEIHAHLAATLRRGGMDERARYHDNMVEKLALGSSSSAMAIGGSYAYAGDFDRADIWYRRAVIEADFANMEFSAALEKYAEKNVRIRNWTVAASCHEVLVHINYASQYYREGTLHHFTKARMYADLSRALSIFPEQKEVALEKLKAIHQGFMPDGVLADDFFPALREVGLNQQLEAWFAESWGLMEAVIKKSPKSHNTRNTAAWFASRAGIKVAEADKYLAEAIRMSPEQAAYLDTMAELKFAQGDRKAALEWSQRSLCFSPFDPMIRLQNERFRTAPLPKN
jgi:tetratricopeptide (TPR) repeat protein